MIRRRRLRLTPGTDRTLPDSHDPSLPQVSPKQPAPIVPIPPPEPAPEPPPMPDTTPESPDPKPTDRDAASPTTPPRPGKVLPAPRPAPGPAPSTAPLQLQLRDEHTDLPQPKDDRASVRVRGVWMRTDDDDRLSRRGTRDDLWSLQRAQRRPQPQPTL
jgi:hypothetical protein